MLFLNGYIKVFEPNADIQVILGRNASSVKLALHQPYPNLKNIRHMLYNEKKAAQVAAFFLQSEGSTMSLLKLMKLMYLSERKSLEEYGEPMIGDKLCSMEHGPVLSHTLNHINGVRQSSDDGWDSWVSERTNHELSLVRKLGNIREDLSLLSDADIEILEKLWAEFGGFTAYELRDYTHEACEEWEDPENSSTNIPYSRLLRCVGYDVKTAKDIEQRMCAQRQVEKAFLS
ncbi:MAG: Panacea domain-containing protein [Nitrosomonadales bacterium]